MLVAASPKHPSELLTTQSWHRPGRRTWRSGWRTWGCPSSLGPPLIYCLKIRECTYSQLQARGLWELGRDVLRQHSYLAMRCESRLKGRLWMKTTPGPVRDAFSWLTPCIRWCFSVQRNKGNLNTKEHAAPLEQVVGKGEAGYIHPEYKDCSSMWGRIL